MTPSSKKPFADSERRQKMAPQRSRGCLRDQDDAEHRLRLEEEKRTIVGLPDQPIRLFPPRRPMWWKRCLSGSGPSGGSLEDDPEVHALAEAILDGWDTDQLLSLTKTRRSMKRHAAACGEGSRRCREQMEPPNAKHPRREEVVARLHDEMIEDILNAPLEELEDEIRERGENPNTIADTLRARLSRAQEQVIDAKLAAANAIPRKAKSPPLPGASSSTLPSARSEIATVTPLTLQLGTPNGLWASTIHPLMTISESSDPRPGTTTRICHVSKGVSRRAASARPRDSHPEHIDLERIARSQGAKIRYRMLNGCEARIVGENDRAMISIDERVRSGDSASRLAMSLGTGCATVASALPARRWTSAVAASAPSRRRRWPTATPRTFSCRASFSGRS